MGIQRLIKKFYYIYIQLIINIIILIMESFTNNRKITMALTKQSKQLVTPVELYNEFPLTPQAKAFVEESRQAISRILCGTDSRILLITGPCSVHDVDAVKEYAKRLKKLQEEVGEVFFIVMRVYFEKPRTKVGWKGLLFDPYIDGSDKLDEGIKMTRKLLVDITEMGLPIASEIVEPLSIYYFDKLLSWVCIGARTTSSQAHREMVSSLAIPVAYKNDLHGDITNAVHSVIASDTEHSFFGIDEKGGISLINSKGNPFGHIVLRGGKDAPNYDRESVSKAVQIMEKEGLLSGLIIDCSHDNCRKNIEKMAEVFKDVTQQVVEDQTAIRGIMIESFLDPGNQPMQPDRSLLKPTVSITDPCLDWNTTEILVRWAHQQLREKLGQTA